MNNEVRTKRSVSEDEESKSTMRMMDLPWDKDSQADSHSSGNSNSEEDEGNDGDIQEVKRRMSDRSASPLPETLKTPLKRLSRSTSRLFQKPDDTFLGLPSLISSSSEEYQRVHFKDRVNDKESFEASKHLLSMCDLRDKYVYLKPDVYWGSYDAKKYQEFYDRSEEELEKKGRWRKEMPFYARTRSTESKPHPFRDLKRTEHMYRKSGGVFRVYIPKETDEEREKYVWCSSVCSRAYYSFNEMFQLRSLKNQSLSIHRYYVKPPSMQEFYKDYLYIVKTMNLGPVRVVWSCSRTNRRICLLYQLTKHRYEA